jgi:hypothetical protein
VQWEWAVGGTMASSPHVQRSSSVFRNVKREVKAADTTIDEYGNRVEVRIRQTCVVVCV